MPLVIAGATSGSTTVQATDAVTATITLPSATTTLVGATTPSFTTTIGVGGATPSASGAGITFPATQSASSNANTLDDYEEGTWTPAYSSSGATFTYGAEVYGSYTKIGRQVTCQFRIKAATVSGTTTNPVAVSGLPFASANLNTYNSSGVAIGLCTLGAAISGTVDNNSSLISLWITGSTGQPVASATPGAFLMGSVTYFTA
jgi:hypothetical protein